MKFTSLKQLSEYFDSLTLEKADEFYKATGLALIIQSGKVIGFTK